MDHYINLPWWCTPEQVASITTQWRELVEHVELLGDIQRGIEARARNDQLYAEYLGVSLADLTEPPAFNHEPLPPLPAPHIPRPPGRLTRKPVGPIATPVIPEPPAFDAAPLEPFPVRESQPDVDGILAECRDALAGWQYIVPVPSLDVITSEPDVGDRIADCTPPYNDPVYWAGRLSATNWVPPQEPLEYVPRPKSFDWGMTAVADKLAELTSDGYRSTGKARMNEGNWRGIISQHYVACGLPKPSYPYQLAGPIELIAANEYGKLNSDNNGEVGWRTLLAAVLHKLKLQGVSYVEQYASERLDIPVIEI